MELSHTVALGYAFTESSNVPVWLWMLSAIIYGLADQQPDLVDHVHKPLHDRLARHDCGSKPRADHRLGLLPRSLGVDDRPGQHAGGQAGDA